MTFHSKSRIRTKKRNLGFAVCFIFVLTVCVFVNFKRVLLSGEYNKAVREKDAVEEEYKVEQARADELARLNVDSKTRKFVEDTAREKFGLVYKNEIIFEPESEQN